MKLRFMGRLATAALAATLWLGIGSMGTAFAAQAPDTGGGTVRVAIQSPTPLKPDANGFYTNTIIVTNMGSHPVTNVHLILPFDPALVKLVDVAIAREGAWVTQVMPNAFEAHLGRLGSNGDAITLTARYTALPGYTGEAAMPIQYTTAWNDKDGRHTATGNAFLMPSRAGSTAAVVRAAPLTRVGDDVRLYGAAFSPGEPVAFWLNRPDGTSTALFVHETDLTVERRWKDYDTGQYVNNSQYMIADATGAINVTFPVQDLARGNYTIVAHGLVNGHEIVFPFTI